MAYRKPTNPYWTLLLIAVPHGGNWIFETFIKTQNWWAELPLVWFTALFSAVGVGLVMGDLYNPHSWLRHNLREWSKVFEVKACFIGQEFSPHEFFSLVCLLKFTRDIRDAKLIVKVIQIRPGGNHVQVVHFEKITMPKDSERSLRLGSIPVTHPGDPFARHALWGEILGDKDLLPNQHPIAGGPAVIEVSLSRQKYCAYVSQIPQHIGDARPEFSLMNEADLEAFSAAKQ